MDPIKKVLNDVLNDKRFRPEERLLCNSYISVSGFLKDYEDVYNLVRNASLQQDERIINEDFVHNLRYFYSALSFYPIREYLDYLFKHLYMSTLSEWIEKSRQFSYICPINKIYYSLKSLPPDISGQLLAQTNSITLIEAFEGENTEEFVKSLRDVKSGVNDLLLICGLNLRFIDTYLKDIKKGISLNQLNIDYSCFYITDHNNLINKYSMIDRGKTEYYVGSTCYYLTIFHKLFQNSILTLIDVIIQKYIYKKDLFEYVEKAANIIDGDNFDDRNRIKMLNSLVYISNKSMINDVNSAISAVEKLISDKSQLSPSMRNDYVHENNKIKTFKLISKLTKEEVQKLTDGLKTKGFIHLETSPNRLAHVLSGEVYDGDIPVKWIKVSSRTGGFNRRSVINFLRLLGVGWEYLTPKNLNSCFICPSEKTYIPFKSHNLKDKKGKYNALSEFNEDLKAIIDVALGGGHPICRQMEKVLLIE